MRIGIFAGTTGALSIDEIRRDVAAAAESGFDTYWLPQIFAWDAMTVLSVVAQAVPTIRFGTAVVPTYTRHPWALAQQALTTAALTEGRFALGVGLSHRVVVEDMWGLSFERPVAHLRQYLDVLAPLLEERRVDHSGPDVSAHGRLELPPTRCPLLVAALGPRMLELAGARCDGTITWMTGPATLAGHTVPTLAGAARRAGREAPRVVVGVPVCVTSDSSTARDRAAQAYRAYGRLPSYRAMLDREGLDGPADLALIGGEDEVRQRLVGYAQAGTTDLAASEFGPTVTDRRRTRALLADVARHGL
jgi:5,10-methylenetetrahydromethanopterin reductase